MQLGEHLQTDDVLVVSSPTTAVTAVERSLPCLLMKSLGTFLAVETIAIVLKVHCSGGCAPARMSGDQ